jgi:hypothetical protein
MNRETGPPFEATVEVSATINDIFLGADADGGRSFPCRTEGASVDRMMRQGKGTNEPGTELSSR